MVASDLRTPAVANGKTLSGTGGGTRTHTAQGLRILSPYRNMLRHCIHAQKRDFKIYVARNVAPANTANLLLHNATVPETDGRRNINRTLTNPIKTTEPAQFADTNDNQHPAQPNLLKVLTGKTVQFVLLAKIPHTTHQHTSKMLLFSRHLLDKENWQSSENHCITMKRDDISRQQKGYKDGRVYRLFRDLCGWTGFRSCAAPTRCCGVG